MTLEHFEQDIGNIQGENGTMKQKFQKMVISKTKSQQLNSINRKIL